VREWLPTNRKIKELERLWARGHELAQRVIASADWDKWANERGEWFREAEAWLAQNFSPIDTERFRIGPVPGQTWHHGVNIQHHRAITTINRQLDQLLRLSAEEERHLR
jgi:hypothetical protein